MTIGDKHLIAKGYRKVSEHAKERKKIALQEAARYRSNGYYARVVLDSKALETKTILHTVYIKEKVLKAPMVEYKWFCRCGYVQHGKMRVAGDEDREQLNSMRQQFWAVHTGEGHGLCDGKTTKRVMQQYKIRMAAEAATKRNSESAD